MCKCILLASLRGVANKPETDPKQTVPDADEFEHLFSECVEQTLTDLLGAKVREALLDLLERHDRVGRNDMLGHPREVSMLLHEMFGKAGITIERCIIRRLYASLKSEYKGTSDLNFDFKLQLEEARACWEKSHNAIA